MKNGFKVLVAAAVLTSLAGSATAQTACGDRDKIVGQLQAKYQESHRASGLETDTKITTNQRTSGLVAKTYRMFQSTSAAMGR